MNINPLYLQQSAQIASLIGVTPDWVQGGGGNFSIKINNQMMLIKASGLSLKEVDESRGIVLVDYIKVKEYFNSLSGQKITVEMENLSNQVVRNFTSSFLTDKNLKASIEVGFHAFLRKYTIHSHSVYANLINCSTYPEKLLKNIFRKVNIEYVLVDYGAPGLNLTKQIVASFKKHLKKGNGWPEVIFLKNHGIIINTDEFDRCLNLHLQIDKMIKQYFNIKSAYPKVSIKKYKDKFRSNTMFLKKYFNNARLNKNLFEPILFPDQVVYLNKKITDKNNLLQLGDKFFIDKKTKNLFYHTNQKESLTIEETVIAYCYIKENIKRLKLGFKKISNIDINFINKMESEKYRQLQLK